MNMVRCKLKEIYLGISFMFYLDTQILSARTTLGGVFNRRVVVSNDRGCGCVDKFDPIRLLHIQIQWNLDPWNSYPSRIRKDRALHPIWKILPSYMHGRRPIKFFFILLCRWWDKYTNLEAHLSMEIVNILQYWKKTNEKRGISVVKDLVGTKEVSKN